MKNRTKVGNKPGNPAYRTGSVFRYKQYLKVKKSKSEIGRHLNHSEFKSKI
ncbi:hypothetical protein M1506_00180 [Patescibacteria group bacterium]|nr:hypothetical protein [Patescibacteria group bacterium]